jgi:hypothetical protein
VRSIGGCTGHPTQLRRGRLDLHQTCLESCSKPVYLGVQTGLPSPRSARVLDGTLQAAPRSMLVADLA